MCVPVANEDGALDWGDENPAIFTVVHLNLSGIVTDVDVTIFTIFDDEGLPVDASGRLDAHLR